MTEDKKTTAEGAAISATARAGRDAARGARRFKLGEVLPREAIESAVASHGRLDDVTDAVAGLELEVTTELTTDRASGELFASAWVRVPAPVTPGEFDRIFVGQVARELSALLVKHPDQRDPLLNVADTAARILYDLASGRARLS